MSEEAHNDRPARNRGCGSKRNSSAGATATEGPPPVLTPPRISASAPAAAPTSSAEQMVPCRRAPLHVSLRCPECEWRGGGTTTRRWSTGSTTSSIAPMQSVLDDARMLTRSNMEEQIERFMGRSTPARSCPKTSRPQALALDRQASTTRASSRRCPSSSPARRRRATRFASSTRTRAPARPRRARPSPRSGRTRLGARASQARAGPAGRAPGRARARISGSVTVPSRRSVPRPCPSAQVVRRRQGRRPGAGTRARSRGRRR